jgi:hypothetical protein
MNTFLHFIDVEIKAGGKKGERIAANCPRDNAVHAVATDSLFSSSIARCRQTGANYATAPTHRRHRGEIKETACNAMPN